MRLGIDLDGVVADFDGGWRARYAAEYGTHPPPQTDWDRLHALAGFDDMAAFWAWVRGHRLFRHLDPLPGAPETLATLARDGHEVVVLSSKPDWAIADTLHWLAVHEIPTREIHFRSDKHAVACDVYLDDSPLVLPELTVHRPHAMVCRMVAPWNRPVAGAQDVADWPTFATAVADHAAASVVGRGDHPARYVNASR